MAKIVVHLPDGMPVPAIHMQIKCDVVEHWLNALGRFDDLKAYQDGDDRFEDEARAAGMRIQVEE